MDSSNKFTITLSQITLASIFSISISCSFSSCEEILKIDPPNSKIDTKLVYENEATANSAITGIYNGMFRPDGFASGSDKSVTALAGLSADDFVTFNRIALGPVEFDLNSLSSVNPNIVAIWNSCYKTIYEANAAINGLDNSPLPTLIRNQFKGEAHFIRAFCHFYLVNLFGEVPIVTSPNYSTNARVTRQGIDVVYEQITNDLLLAQSLLSETYKGTDRVRPNKFAAKALLARVYLYRGKWVDAEITAGAVIENADYSIPTLDEAFLFYSTEAIWQLQPVEPDKNTYEGYYFIISEANPPVFVLAPSLIESFDPVDMRLTSWVMSISIEDSTYHYPYKYKINRGTPGMEYSMVLRLSEQYLIRSEARARQNKLPDAIADVDVVRNRAGLPLLAVNSPDISQDDLIEAILNERRHELFTEWGHRWLDLKRTELAIPVLSSIKAGLTNDDLLYPLPLEEFILNPYLGLQNHGY